MPYERPALNVLKTGEITVVGFGRNDVLELISPDACLAQIAEIITANQPKTLAFDLTGVSMLPSAVLALMVTLKKRVAIQIFNPSDNVREVLKITKLDRLFEVRETASEPRRVDPLS